MKRFEVGKAYQNINWNGFGYSQDGTVTLLSRTPEERTNRWGANFKRWPAIIKGKKTWVDLQEDTVNGYETIHEISPISGEWKRNTVRYGVTEI